MLAVLQSRFSKAPRWLQVAAVLAAGAASFWLSFSVGTRDRRAVSDAMSNLVVPAKSSANIPAVEPEPSAAVDGANDLTSASRLGANILRNPFAPLNLQASVDKPIVVAVAEPMPQKKPPPPPPAPPPVAPPIVVAQPPPPPTAPPLPFVVLGAIRGLGIADGQPVVFLNDRGTTIAVSAGDAIHGTYKVEAISATAIEFIYLPLGQRQSLALAK